MKKGWKRQPDGTFAPPPEDAVAGSYAKVVDVEAVSSDDLASLKSTIADLEARLKASEDARSSEEQSNLDMVKAQGFSMGDQVTERPTGRTVSIEKCSGYERVGFEKGRAIYEPKFKTVTVPTYYYKIMMAPCGGLQARLNGQDFVHGSVVEVDIDTLRTLKDIVFRTWSHEGSIHDLTDHRKNIATVSARY